MDFNLIICNCVVYVLFLGLFIVVTVCNCDLKVHFWIIISWLNVCVVMLLTLQFLLMIKYYPFSIYDSSYHTLFVIILFYNILYTLTLHYINSITINLIYFFFFLIHYSLLLYLFPTYYVMFDIFKMISITLIRE